MIKWMNVKNHDSSASSNFIDIYIKHEVGENGPFNKSAKANQQSRFKTISMVHLTTINIFHFPSPSYNSLNNVLN